MGGYGLNYKSLEFDSLINEDVALIEDSVSWRKRKAQVYVYIKSSVIKEIDQYGSSDQSRELGGVLLGDYEDIGNERFIVRVEAAIKALHSEGGRANVKFTHDTWDYINQVKERYYKELKIVGWFHTHPGFGIFLSDYDAFIQSNFFNLPWHVAYVVDPIKKTHGFFGLANGSITRIDFEQVNEERNASRQKKILSNDSRKAKNELARNIISFFLGGLLLLTLVGAAYFYTQNLEFEAKVRQLEREVNELEEDKQKLQNEKGSIKSDKEKLIFELDETRVERNRYKEVIDLLKTKDPVLKEDISHYKERQKEEIIDYQSHDNMLEQPY